MQDCYIRLYKVKQAIILTFKLVAARMGKWTITTGVVDAPVGERKGCREDSRRGSWLREGV